MFRVILVSVFIIISTFLNAQNSRNVDLLYNWQSADTNVTGYNDIWGFENNGREYAIIGSNWGIHFVDVTSDLNEPIEISSFEGKANDVTWRDFKVYSHYAYGVADGDSNSLQIFDFQSLPDSVIKVVDSTYYSESSHNIFIDSNRLYFCANQVNGNKSNQALDVFSLANPTNPSRLKSYSETYFDEYALHDLYVRDNIAFCSAGNGGLHIYDLNDVENPIIKARLNIYPEQGYNHSSWLSEDGTKLVVADEVPSALALKLFDVSDLDNIEFLDIFHSNDFATPHNPFFIKDKIIVSYYLDGVQIFDYSNVFSVKRVGYYDTYPDDTSYFDTSPYGGCWGVYPFLPSENIIASDRTYGLYVLKTDYELLTSENESVKNELDVKLYPNPSINQVFISSEKDIESYYVYNNLGVLIAKNELMNAKKNITIDIRSYIAGKYLVALKSKNQNFKTIKFIK